MKFTFEEVKKIDFELDFQTIYDYVKNDQINADHDYKPTKWDIHTTFGDNMDYFIEKIYNYEIEDTDYNQAALEYLWEEWSNWIKNYNED